MNCSEIAGVAPLYRTGELDPARAAIVADHLDACPECAGDLRQEQQLDDLLRAAILTDVVDSAALDHRVRQGIAAELAGLRRTTPAISSRSLWRFAAIGAVAATLLLAVGYRRLSRPYNVYADAAADHRSEVVEAHWRPWVTDPAQITALAQRSGIAPSAILDLAPPAYRLARAKRCALDGRPFLHLVYSNGVREFSAYLRPRDVEPFAASAGRSRSSGLYTADFGAQHLGCVQTPELTAMIVTDESVSAAADLARFAATALAAPAASHF